MSNYPSRNCPVCDGAESRSLGPLRDHLSHEAFDLHECVGCGHWYLKDPPPPERMAGYYRNYAGEVMRGRPSGFFLALQRWRLTRDLAELRAMLRPGARVLDFGTGDGALCECLVHLGYQAKGLDYYPASDWPLTQIPYESVDLNRHALPEPIFRFPDGRLPDAVVIRHVLEHLHAPKNVLKTLNGLGIPHVLVVVPNVGSRLRRLCGTNWAYWDPPRHLSHFSFSALEALAGQAGYKVTVKRTYGIDEVFFSLFRLGLLRRPGPASAIPPWVRWCNPKGFLAAVSSSIAAAFGNTVCLCLLEQDRA